MIQVIYLVLEHSKGPSFNNDWHFIHGEPGNINGSEISFPATESLARTIHSIPHTLKTCDFEVHIAKGFKDPEDGQLAIGLTTKDSSSPGGDQNTAAYMSINGDGSIYQDGDELTTLQGISQGETIRCNLEFVEAGNQIFTVYSFFKNDEVISQKRYINSGELYPTIYVDGEGLEVKTKFIAFENKTSIGILIFVFIHVKHRTRYTTD